MKRRRLGSDDGSPYQSPPPSYCTRAMVKLPSCSPAEGKTDPATTSVTAVAMMLVCTACRVRTLWSLCRAIQDSEFSCYPATVLGFGDEVVDAGSNQKAGRVEAIPRQRADAGLTGDLEDEFTSEVVNAQ